MGTDEIENTLKKSPLWDILSPEQKRSYVEETCCRYSNIDEVEPKNEQP